MSNTEKNSITRLANDSLIKLTESASNKVKQLLEKEEAGSYLRINISGGGCSGLNYEMEFVNLTDPRDLIVDIGVGFIAVDPKSALYLKGTTLDYSKKMIAGGFKFTNPNAKTSCSCGDSFSI